MRSLRRRARSAATSILCGEGKREETPRLAQGAGRRAPPSSRGGGSGSRLSESRFIRVSYSLQRASPPSAQSIGRCVRVACCSRARARAHRATGRLTEGAPRRESRKSEFPGREELWNPGRELAGRPGLGRAGGNRAFPRAPIWARNNGRPDSEAKLGSAGRRPGPGRPEMRPEPEARSAKDHGHAAVRNCFHAPASAVTVEVPADRSLTQGRCQCRGRAWASIPSRRRVKLERPRAGGVSGQHRLRRS